MSKWPIQAKDAAHYAGLTRMMLDYLERQELFVRDEIRLKEPSSTRAYGRRRKYSFRDVVVLKAINQLLGKGISVQRIKRAVKMFCEDGRFVCDRTKLHYDNAAFQYLVTDGKDVFFRRDGSDIVSLLKDGQGTFYFVLDLADSHRRLCELEAPKARMRSS